MAGASSIKKLVDFIWGEPEDSQEDYEENNAYNSDYVDDYEQEEEQGNETGGFFKKKNKIVSMPQPQQIKMKISKPTNFDQADEIVMQLKEKDVARRIVDVVCGAVKALDGNMEKVSNSIFVVAPYNYDIVNEITKEKIENKFSASWIK